MLLSAVSARSIWQRLLWVALLLVGRCGSFAQTSDVAGTMPEDYVPQLKGILEAAVKQSPEVLRREIDIARSEARVIDADHERWPSVAGDIRYDSNQSAISTNESTKSRDSGLFYNVGANQALFYWGAIKHTGDIARIELAISRKEYADAYRLLIAELRADFLELIWQKGRVAWSRGTLEQRAADLASAKDKFAHGTASRGDVDSREIAFEQAQFELDRLTLDFDGKRRHVGRLSGLTDIAVEDIPDDIPDPVPHPDLTNRLLAQVLRDGGRNSFRAQVAEMKIREADLNYKIARVRLLPKFNAGVSHSRESSTTASVNEISQTAITRDTFELRGSWTVFDGFATKAAKLMAKADRRSYERELQIASETTMDEAQRLARLVGVDERGLKLANYRVVAADALMKRTEDELKAGRAASSDLDEAQNNSRFARYYAAQARATYLADWAAFVSNVTDDPALHYLPSRYVRAHR